MSTKYSSSPKFRPRTSDASQKVDLAAETRTRTERAAYKEFFAVFIAMLLTIGVAVIFLPLPFFLCGAKFTGANNGSNPLSFSALLTGVVALVGLYYIIESDNGAKFEGPAGEAVQKLLVGAILLVGFLNVEWEFLAHLPAEVFASFSLSDDPPIWTLFKTLMHPSVSFLLIATSLVLAFCVIARASLALTPRGFARQINFMSERHAKQSQVFDCYDQTAKVIRKTQMHWLAKPRVLGTFELRLRLVVRTAIPPLIGTLLLWPISRITSDWSSRFSWGYRDLNQPIFLWFFATFSFAWIMLEIASHLHKRSLVSLGYLSPAGGTKLIALGLSLQSLIFLMIACLLGPYAAISAALLLILRALRHHSQVQIIKTLRQHATLKGCIHE